MQIQHQESKSVLPAEGAEGSSSASFPYSDGSGSFAEGKTA